MNIEQFELILCDMYTMDAWSPPLLWNCLLYTSDAADE